MTLCIRTKLLPTIEGYLLATGTAPAIFGQAAVNDPSCMDELRKGGQLRQATAMRLLDHMTNHLEALTAPKYRPRRASINRTVLMPAPIAAPADYPAVEGQL